MVECSFRNKWLWFRVSLLSLKLQIWRLLRARSSLTFRQTIECGFTLKLVRDKIITHSLISYYYCITAVTDMTMISMIIIHFFIVYLSTVLLIVNTIIAIIIIIILIVVSITIFLIVLFALILS